MATLPGGAGGLPMTELGSELWLEQRTAAAVRAGPHPVGGQTGRRFRGLGLRVWVSDVVKVGRREG